MVFTHAVTADQCFGADARRAFAIAREHLNHSARVAAIQRRSGAAQYFDALGGVQVERCRLTLAIRGAGRNAIGNQFDTAYTKRRTRAKASGRNLQVLGIVLTVLHHQPRHSGQDFGRVNAQLAVADLRLVDAVNRVRQIKTRAGAA